MPIERIDNQFKGKVVDQRNAMLLKSLEVEQPGFLCWLCVREYEESPTKSKAISIYDAFIRSEKAYGDLGEFNGSNRTHANVKGVLETQIGNYFHLRARARSSTWIGRVLTSGSRKPNPYVFDAFNDATKLFGVQSQLKGWIQDYGNRNRKFFVLGGWKPRANWTCGILGAGGFPMGRWGLRTFEVDGKQMLAPPPPDSFGW